MRSRSLVVVFVIITYILTTPFCSAEGFLDNSTVSTKIRTVHFDRDFENDANDFKQSALGLELNYSSGYLGGILGFNASGYQIQKLADSGVKVGELFPVNRGGRYEHSVSKFGQAYLKLNINDVLSAKLGRQKVKAMLLASSTSRAVPSSFEGGSVNIKSSNFEFYGVRFDEWSPRHKSQFIDFSSNVVTGETIDYVSVVGINYKSGLFTARVEKLNSKEYLEKLGVVLTYDFMYQNAKMKLSGGYFTSQDDGDLFVAGSAKGYIDDTTTDNDARAYYMDLDWRRNNISLGMAVTAIRDDVWIENNFVGDHGRNPFPTRAPSGQDLTGKNENVWQLRAGYDWRDYVPGLTTRMSYAYGSDAENTSDKSLGLANEWYRAIDMKWKIKPVKGLSFRWLIVDYRSSEKGTVAQVKQDNFDNRIYLDYTIKL